MAFIVMFSTMSMTINKHYCSNILVDTAVFQEAKTCEMHKELSNIKSQKDEGKLEHHCCSNEQHIVVGQDELQLQLNDFSFEQQVFMTSFIQTYYELFRFESSENPTYSNYKPPLYFYDFQVINQVFLI